MRTLKRILQDWLGITALANKIVREDIRSGRVFDEANEEITQSVGEIFLSLGVDQEEELNVKRGYRP